MACVSGAMLRGGERRRASSRGAAGARSHTAKARRVVSGKSRAARAGEAHVARLVRSPMPAESSSSAFRMACDGGSAEHGYTRDDWRSARQPGAGKRAGSRRSAPPRWQTPHLLYAVRRMGRWRYLRRHSGGAPCGRFAPRGSAPGLAEAFAVSGGRAIEARYPFPAKAGPRGRQRVPRPTASRKQLSQLVGLASAGERSKGTRWRTRNSACRPLRGGQLRCCKHRRVHVGLISALVPFLTRFPLMPVSSSGAAITSSSSWCVF